MATKDLDAGNVIKQVYDPASESIQTTITGSTGPIEISATTPIPVTIGGLGTLSTIISTEIDFSSIPDSSSAPFEIVLALPLTARRFKIYDTTGVSTQIRYGAAVGNLLYIAGPGEDSSVEVEVTTGTRISIRSNGSAPTAGSLIFTIFGS